VAPQATVTKDFRRTTLKARHRPVVRALGEAFFSPDGEATGAELDALVADVDAFVSPASKTLRFGLLLMLDVLRWSPVLFGRFTLFDELPVDDRIHVLEKLEGSRIVQAPLLVVGYKTLMSMLFYEAPERMRALGYTEERRRYRALPVVRADAGASASANDGAGAPRPSGSVGADAR
jgi:hypothetical protein